MKTSRTLLVAIAAQLTLAAAEPAAADCKIRKIAELPVTLTSVGPVVAATINRHDARFLVDSGAFSSIISEATAKEYGVQTGNRRISVSGSTGAISASIGTVDDFSLSNIPMHEFGLLVGGSEPGGDAVGIIGQNVLHVGDVEYDLANGVIRILKPDNCGQAPLAYWSPPGGFSSVGMKQTFKPRPQAVVEVAVNGAVLRAMLDTGSQTSTLMRNGADKARIDLASPTAIPASPLHGVGQSVARSWTVPVAKIKIGEEEIDNTHLTALGVARSDVDMLLGRDFFLSHRIYVANSQWRVYFSYKGGKVFDISPHPTAVEPSPTAQLAQIASAQGETASASDVNDEPKDAAGYSRRAAALLGRHEYRQAISDLDRAVELAPTNGEYLYARARARFADDQGQLAVADLDQALKLSPDNVSALIRSHLLTVLNQPAPYSPPSTSSVLLRRTPRRPPHR